MKVAIPFGGGKGMSEEVEVETFGEAPPPLLLPKDKFHAVILFCDPSPLPEFLDPPLLLDINLLL